MKHVCTVVCVLALVMSLAALGLLMTGRTALASASGLVKVLAVATGGAILAALARWFANMVERRSRNRWTLAAHPVSWLLGGASLLGVAGLATVAGRQAVRPSLHGDWRIGIYVSAGLAPASFSPLGPQPVLAADHVTDIACAFVADPVLVRHEGGYALFYEAWNTRSGHGDICLSTSPDGIAWTYRGRVLDESCSLSYPTVFCHEGAWYMLPETRELGELRLYRAIRFPDQWRFDRVLLTGAPYRDTNIVKHDDRWYLLTTAGYGEDLLVFYATDPLGPWQPHIGNPVVRNDAGHARGGGNVVAHNGVLWRFTQDVVPYYGNCVRAVAIMALSPTDYVQRPCSSEPALQGHDDWNVRGMHTLWCVQRDDGRWLAAVDGHGQLVNTKAFWRQ